MGVDYKELFTSRLLLMSGAEQHSTALPWQRERDSVGGQCAMEARWRTPSSYAFPMRSPVLAQRMSGYVLSDAGIAIILLCCIRYSRRLTPYAFAMQCPVLSRVRCYQAVGVGARGRADGKVTYAISGASAYAIIVSGTHAMRVFYLLSMCCPGLTLCVSTTRYQCVR
eukprot:3157031-Rhodomonas_salina.5